MFPIVGIPDVKVCIPSKSVFTGDIQPQVTSVSPDCRCGTPGCEHQAEGVPCKCLKGYEHTTVSGGCQDIDECQVYYGVCLENNTCVNEEGKYRCVCGNENYILIHGVVCVESFEQDDEEQEDNNDKTGRKTWKFPETPAVLAAELSLSLVLIFYFTYICVLNALLVMFSIHAFVTTDPVLTDDDESDEEKCKRVDLTGVMLALYHTSARIATGDDKDNDGSSGVNTTLSSVDVLDRSISKYRQHMRFETWIDIGDDEEYYDLVPGNSNVTTSYSSVLAGSAITRLKQPKNLKTERSLVRIKSSSVDGM